jgi:rapamycin-insensitive companion of mTOR
MRFAHWAIREFDGTVPSHFYGEMSKTELGCQVLQEKGHFSEFSDFIRRHGFECGDPELILKLKSILWAVVSSATAELYRLLSLMFPNY